MQRIRALLVHADAEPLQSLNLALQKLSVETDQAPTCQQARNFLERATKPPDIVFTDTALPDGTWQDLLAMAGRSRARSKVIVVSRTEDPWLYLDAMERGAFDFMLPPFATSDVGYILRRATGERAAKAAGAA
jgi:two-component system, NtrC family, response regulator PilR